VGTPEDLSVYYEMLAQACLRGRHFEEGLRALEDAFAQTERHGILFWNAELHRRRGDLLLAAGAPSESAVACFNQALDCARQQGALALELGAATRLARLHKQDAPMALARLRAVYERIPDKDTPDATDARALLETLA
jgi:adenylate cyclase